MCHLVMWDAINLINKLILGFYEYFLVELFAFIIVCEIVKVRRYNDKFNTPYFLDIEK